MGNENKILSAERVAEMSERAERLLYPRLLTIEEASELLASHEALRDVLALLLNDSERNDAGFPNGIELRFAIRDAARAALKGKP